MTLAVELDTNALEAYCCNLEGQNVVTKEPLEETNIFQLADDLEKGVSRLCKHAGSIDYLHMSPPCQKLSKM